MMMAVRDRAEMASRRGPCIRFRTERPVGNGMFRQYRLPSIQRHLLTTLLSDLGLVRKPLIDKWVRRCWFTAGPRDFQPKELRSRDPLHCGGLDLAPESTK